MWLWEVVGTGKGRSAVLDKKSVFITYVACGFGEEVEGFWVGVLIGHC